MSKDDTYGYAKLDGENLWSLNTTRGTIGHWEKPEAWEVVLPREDHNDCG